MDILFLGSGTSHGIPMIGCDCPVCRSDDPRDRRFRASLAVQLPDWPPTDGRVILIDVSPEFRLAAVRDRLARVDAILFTHGHADHIMGLDDVRRYNRLGAAIPCYADGPTLEKVRRCFGYAVTPYNASPDRPSITLDLLTSPREICGVTVTPIPLHHGRAMIQGYRIGGLAYCTDCSGIPDESCALLAGLDVLVIDALRHRPHEAHFNLEQALAAVARIAPRRALLTHIAHEIGHAKTSAHLPAGVEIAYDGLRVPVEPGP